MIMNKPRMLATYGIRSDGQGISRLLEAISGEFEIDLFHHPRRHTWHAWDRATVLSDAEGLKRRADRCTTPPDVMAHSYGALIVIMSMWLGARYRYVYLFGAAASSDTLPLHLLADNGQFEQLYNFYNVKDRALKLGALLPCHPFGHLGYSGWRGPARNNIVDRDFFMTKGLLRHSGYFDADNIAKIRGLISRGTASCS